MRTTLDLPDPLMRELKARAAMDGVKLKDYFAAMVREALLHPPGAAATPARSPAPRIPAKEPRRIADPAGLEQCTTGRAAGCRGRWAISRAF